MPHSTASARNCQIGEVQSRGGSEAVRRALVFVWGLGLGSACVDLTPPPEVVNYRNSLKSGGAVGTSGGAGEGGTLGTGGSPGAGGVVGGSGGTTSAGGSTVQPDARGGGGLAGADVALGSGGEASTGGSGVARDAAAGAGGATGRGGERIDVSSGKGGASSDAPIVTGGAVGTGGLAGTGGVVGSGGLIVGSGGAAGTGGLTGSGGVVGSGGATGTGGATGKGGATGSGGTTGYACANAIVPASGVITDFSNWDASAAKWGSGTLTGTIYQYASTNATMNAAKVEGTPKGLHLTGKVPAGSYGGGGLTFLSCVTVASFTKIQFDVYGSALNCAVELQLQTFDQRPTDQSPPGSCAKAADGSGCFAFPVMRQVVALSTAVAAPGRMVSTALASFASWSTSAAGQIVGMQWQFTHGSGGDCAVDATFTNIKFVP
jgi:hypothetical protein